MVFIRENVSKRRRIKRPDTDELQVVTYPVRNFQIKDIKRVVNTVEHFVNILICFGRYYVSFSIT